MKQGKIAENVLKRSVLKPIQSHTEKKANGAVTGSDCAFLAYKMQTISLPVAGDVLMRHGIYAAVNALAAEGYTPQNILLGISIPERMREIRLKIMMEAAQDVCMQENLQILGGHTEVSDAVSTPVLSVTATGTGAVTGGEKGSGTGYCCNQIYRNGSGGASGTGEGSTAACTFSKSHGRKGERLREVSFYPSGGCNRR